MVIELRHYGPNALALVEDEEGEIGPLVHEVSVGVNGVRLA